MQHVQDGARRFQQRPVRQEFQHQRPGSSNSSCDRILLHLYRIEALQSPRRGSRGLDRRMFKPVLKQMAATLLLAAATVAHVSAVPRQDSGSWELVAPPAEGFTVRMPLKPEEQSDRIPFEGNTYLMRMYTVPEDR